MNAEDSRSQNIASTHVVLRVILFPLLSGLLYWLSSQAFSFPLAVWICLVPLGLALYGASPFEGLAGGFAYGFFFWIFAVWWIKIQLIGMIGLPAWQAWGWTMIFAAFHALPYAVFGYLAGKFRLMESHKGAAWAAVSLVVIRTWYPHVFPGSEAHNLYAWPLFIQVLDLGGAPLLLFFIYFVNFQIAHALTAWRTRRSPAPALVGVALAFLILVGYGGYRLHSLHREMKTKQSGRHISVVFVQPNVPVNQGSRDVPPEDRYNDMKTALAYSREAALRHAGAGLVVLPEIPSSYSCREEASRDVPPVARKSANAFLLPCMSMVGNRDEAYYNSVIFVDRHGAVGKEYRKLILVPFGEYIPMEGQFPFLRRIFPGVMPFVAGNHGEVVYELEEGIHLIPSLCYEAIFTDHTRRFVERGGNVLVNMVDDAWFGKSPASVIHMSLALFRSVEYRIPLVRVTNSGVGIFVEPTGDMVPGSRTPLFQKAASVHTLYIPPGRSPYERWGDVFLYGFTLLFIVGLAWSCFRQRGGTAEGSRSSLRR
ncbi:MAG: apolipoprotein N-acyltransferase [Deltaproteobacteria bacterium]|jgi:apolipoprotein N-acyltransferase|nr:apolipoprotein N-acyltransferase [Syntrophaceae bacterium]